jgi:XXXCH domain-containing protein
MGKPPNGKGETMSNKTERYMTREKFPELLRELADILEGKTPEDLECPSDFRKFKLKAKECYGRLEVKLKVNDDMEACTLREEGEATTESVPAASDEESGKTKKPSYEKLKERMKRSFRMIFRMIHDDEIPPRAAVEEFLRDSALMVTYPGYGDEYYEEYSRVCSAFSEAFEAQDLAALHETVDQLQDLKSHCHARYD